MNDAMENRLKGVRTKHNPEVVKDLLDSMISVRDLTKQRILVNEFPYSAINYNAEDNYRKTGIDPQHESLKELGKGILKTGLQQSIALIAYDLSAEELREKSRMESNALRNPETWLGNVGIIFGNRRYLSITHHTDLTHESALIYPKEIAPWVTTIALAENMDREDTPLIEEALEVVKVINTQFNGVTAELARFLGKSASEVGRLSHIGVACGENELFEEVVRTAIVKDKIALEYLAQAITNKDLSPTRTKNLNKSLNELLAIQGNVVSIRGKAKQLKEYSDGKNNQHSVFDQEKDKAEQKAETAQAQNTEKKSKPFNVKAFGKQLDNITDKFKTLETSAIDVDLRECAKNLRLELDNLGL